MLSATTTRARSGSQRRTWRIICRPQSGSVLCRRPRSTLYRSDGASTVKNGKPQIRPAHGTSASSCIEIQRSPLVLTKWLLLDRTGSR